CAWFRILYSGSDRFKDHGRSATPAVADGSGPGFSVVLFQYRKERDQNAGSGATDGVSQRYRPAMYVYPVGLQSHFFVVGKRNDRKSFVDLEEIDFIGL